MSETNTSKKERIIISALKLFSQNGYQDTKIIDIAKDAEVGKGTIYEYFDDKKQLFEEAIEITMASSNEYLYDNLDLVKEYEPYLKDIIKKEMIIVEKNITLFKLFIQIVNNPIMYKDFKVSKEFHTFQMQRFLVFKKIIENGIDANEFNPVDSELAALNILSSLNAFIVFKFKLHSDFINMPTLESATIDDLLTILINGLK